MAVQLSFVIRSVSSSVLKKNTFAAYVLPIIPRVTSRLYVSGLSNATSVYAPKESYLIFDTPIDDGYSRVLFDFVVLKYRVSELERRLCQTVFGCEVHRLDLL